MIWQFGELGYDYSIEENGRTGRKPVRWDYYEEMHRHDLFDTQNIANPLAQILSVAMLFEYFDLKAEGLLVRKAVDASLDARVRIPEIQVEGVATYGTKEVGAWIVDYIRKA